MNQVHMRKLIKEILNQINHPYPITRSDVQLIEMTFLEESNMEDLYSNGYEDLYGMNMVSAGNFESILINSIRSNQTAIRNIKKVCLIDVEKESIWNLLSIYRSNLSFQILMTFYHYYHNLMGMPTDIEACADAYLSDWESAFEKRKKYDIIKSFINYDNEIKKEFRL